MTVHGAINHNLFKATNVHMMYTKHQPPVQTFKIMFPSTLQTEHRKNKTFLGKYIKPAKMNRGSS